jgi:hypothetical protein
VEFKTLATQFASLGWTIFREQSLSEKITELRSIYLKDYLPKMTADYEINRNLIRRLADHPSTKQIFSSAPLIDEIGKTCGIRVPILCGPTFTHYTSHDHTGRSYGLPFHQDYPSLASSLNAVVCWFNFNATDKNSHGIELVDHQITDRWLYPGEQRDNGYIIKDQELRDTQKSLPQIPFGSVLIFSAFTPHRTHVHPDHLGWKLSLSQRYEDLKHPSCSHNKYRNAYEYCVNRNLYKETLISSKPTDD